jgi:hypothetical protein
VSFDAPCLSCVICVKCSGRDSGEWDQVRSKKASLPANILCIILRLLYAWSKRSKRTFLSSPEHSLIHRHNHYENPLTSSQRQIHSTVSVILNEMDVASAIDQAFTDGLNEAGDLYNSDRLDECIDKTRTIIADPAIPRYHRIKALILLASAVSGWQEAYDLHVEAETIWRVVRRRHPEGDDTDIDGYMQDLRESLDEIGAVLDQTEDEHYENLFEDEVDDAVVAHEEHVKDVTATMKDLDITTNSAASSGSADEMDTVPRADVPAINIAAPPEGAGEIQTDSAARQG